MDLLYPFCCPGCSGWLAPQSTNGEFCAVCQENMVPVTAPFCQVCAEPFPGDITGDFTCPNCSGRSQAYDFAVSLWLSRGPVREAVHRLKYHRVRPVRLALARLMTCAFEDARLHGVSWLLVPVPLHPRKQRQRTYNQSREIARSLAKLTGREYRNALRRIRWTSSQAGLDREGRLHNLRGAFAVPRRLEKQINGRAVLIIDDVLTTGTTAHECAVALKKAGAARVAVLTAARG
jgi:competence protein ComFC